MPAVLPSAPGIRPRSDAQLRTLAVATGVVTVNTPALNLTQTWSNAAVAFTGIKLNITNTNSDAASLLMDLQVGGISKFSVRKDGLVTAAGGIIGAISGSLVVTGDAVTVSTPVLSMTQTWNAGAVAFTGVKLNITDTASAAASLLMDLQVGGSSKFKVDKTGAVTVANAASFFNASANAGIYLGSGDFRAYSSGNAALQFTGTTVGNLGANIVFGWSSSFDAGLGSQDLSLARDAADTLAQRRGANAQSFKVYKTFTDSSNYSRLNIGGATDSATHYLYVEQAGTGAVKDLLIGNSGAGKSLLFYTAGVLRWTMDGNGHFIAGTDNLYDIGASGALRPRSGYFGTSLIVAGVSTVQAAGIISGGYVSAANGSLLGFASRGGFIAAADGVIGIFNNAGSDFGRLQFGGTTSSFPAIKRNGAGIDFRLADDSAYAAIAAAAGTFSGDLFFDTTGRLTLGGGFITLANGATTYFEGSASEFRVPVALKISGNAYLYGEAANVLAQRNGTAAQTLRVYGSWTDASNGDWINITKAAGGAATISTTKNGTGSGSSLEVSATTNLYLTSGNAGASSFINFYTGNSHRWQIDTSGHFQAATTNTYDIGAAGNTTAPRSIYAATGFVGGPLAISAAVTALGSSPFFMSALTGSANLANLIGYGNNASMPFINIGKTRATTTGSTIVQSGDGLGQLSFLGADGTGYIGAAYIRAIVDGTPGTNDMPGRLEFGVTPDGSATIATALTIKNDARIFLSPPVDTSIAFGISGTSGWYFSSGAGYQWNFTSGGTDTMRLSGGSVTMTSSTVFGFTSGALSGTLDTILNRDAANTLALRNSTTAQTFRVYGSYTDGSNYERAFINDNGAGTVTFGGQGAGTGAGVSVLVSAPDASGKVYLSTAGSLRWSVTAGGHLLAQADNTYDIGASGATRPANVYAATSMVAPFFTPSTGTGTGAGIVFNSSTRIVAPSDGSLIFWNAARSDFSLLQLGGTTSSFPALKRSSTVLQARLADDSDFAPLQGKLRTQANAVAETPTATHTMIITDAGGTAYRVLCVV